MGYDGPFDESTIEGILNGFGELSLQAKQGVVKKLTAATRGRGIVSTHDLTGKAEFERRMHLLPQGIQKALRSGQLQLVDKVLYTTRLVGTESQSELMVNSDVAVAGICNLSNRKLDPNQYFLLMGVQLLSGVSSDPKAAAYDSPVNNIINGEFELTVGSTVMIPRTSCEVFRSGDITNFPKSYWKLDNPKMISPQTEFKPFLYCPAPNADNTCVKVCFWGVITQKN